MKHERDRLEVKRQGRENWSWFWRTHKAFEALQADEEDREADEFDPGEAMKGEVR